MFLTIKWSKLIWVKAWDELAKTDSVNRTRFFISQLSLFHQCLCLMQDLSTQDGEEE